MFSLWSNSTNCPLSGALAVAQRGHRREGSARSRRGVHVGRPRTRHELGVEGAAEPQHAGEPVELRPEARVAGPVTGEPGCWHPDDDEARIARLQLAGVDPETGQPARLEVVDEDVGTLHQRQQQLLAFGPPGVDSARELVARQCVVHGVAVPRPVRSVGNALSVERPEEPGVGDRGPGLVALRRRGQDPGILDTDDLRPEIRQQHGGVGTRPHGGQVDDTDPGQWRVVECGAPRRR